MDRYLTLLEGVLTGTLWRDPAMDPWSGGGFDAARRHTGGDWPSRALTMIGTIRLHHLRKLCEEVILKRVPGDFIETGVWRGGACIMMKAVLECYKDENRRVFVADSFKGLPMPDDRYPADANDPHHTFAPLAVRLDEVVENFRRYGLLDDSVVFVEGWFKDTLPTLPVDRLAILRLDGDMYGSTIQALDELYDKVSLGGYVIVDDYNLPGARQAVQNFLNYHRLKPKIQPIDGAAVYWKVERDGRDQDQGLVAITDEGPRPRPAADLPQMGDPGEDQHARPDPGRQGRLAFQPARLFHAGDAGWMAGDPTR